MSKNSHFTPPMRDGVTASTVFLPAKTQFASVFAYFVHHFSHISIEEWQQRFLQGLVFDASGTALTQDTPYLAKQHIYYYRALPYEVEVPFEHRILFENSHFLLVDKPHFLTVSPTGKYVKQTLLTRLKKDSNNPDLSPIHRLDRETAGLILISKQAATRGLYQQLFAQQKVKKTYHAIAPYCGNIAFPLRFSAHLKKGNPFYTMQITEEASNSLTDIDILEHGEKWAKYELKPLTGKQHQLRVHMNALGLPLKNDRFYPQVQHLADDNFNEPLQLLAKNIEFIDPITQHRYSFSSFFDLLLPRE